MKDNALVRDAWALHFAQHHDKWLEDTGGPPQRIATP